MNERRYEQMVIVEIGDLWIRGWLKMTRPFGGDRAMQDRLLFNDTAFECCAKETEEFLVAKMIADRLDIVVTVEVLSSRAGFLAYNDPPGVRSDAMR